MCKSKYIKQKKQGNIGLPRNFFKKADMK